MSTTRKRVLLFAKILVSALLISVLIRQIGGLDSFAETLKRVSWFWCAAAALAAFIHLLVSGFKIWWLLLAAEARVPFSTFIQFYVYSYCFGLILPGQTGDAVITLFLKERGVSLSVSGASYLIDKIITFVFMLLVSAYGFHLLIPEIPLYLILSGVVFLLLAGFILLKSGHLIPTPFPLMEKIKSGILRLNEVSVQILRRRHYILISIILTIFNWGILGLSYYCVFRGLTEPVSWPTVGVIPIMSSFVGYIPVSIAGVGTVEYSAVYLFSLIQTPKAAVLAAYFIQRLIQYSLASFLAGILFLLKSDRKIASC